MSVIGSLRSRPRFGSGAAKTSGESAQGVHVARLNAGCTLTRAQAAAVVVLAVAVACWTWVSPGSLAEAIRLCFLALFGSVSIWRGIAVLIARPPQDVERLPTPDLPPYTIIAPLRGEADMLAGLLAALERIDYPRDRLQVIWALEWDDVETQTAASRLHRPPHVEVLIVPPGSPRTKPRACNAALAIARGEHVVVYDAEDRPDPGQLREAAARFRAGRADLACLQAPLRIPLSGSFTMRQFSLEYAALFELMLPALARLGTPFPLGGTSNHFRVDLLRSVGGWDPCNVTEDADVGFRLAAAGYRSDMLRLATYEDAPRGAREWTPQRARWLKGYMQTWLVHMRRPWSGGAARFVSLQATVAISILSAMIHAPTAILIGGAVVASTLPWGFQPSRPDLMLFAGGWGMAALAMSSGAQRAGLKPRVSDLMLAPAYWSLQSIAFWRALFQLATRPHHWDKTPHHPSEEPPCPALLDQTPGAPVDECA